MWEREAEFIIRVLSVVIETAGICLATTAIHAKQPTGAAGRNSLYGPDMHATASTSSRVRGTCST